MGLDSRLRGNDRGVESVQRPTGRPTLRPISGLYFHGNDGCVARRRQSLDFPVIARHEVPWQSPDMYALCNVEVATLRLQ